jgi:hypothetical protein
LYVFEGITLSPYVLLLSVCPSPRPSFYAHLFVLVHKEEKNMCFSAEASFTASAFLIGIGALTLKKTTSRSEIYLALIPFFFAIQQLAEGFIWLYLKHGIGSHVVFQIAQLGFLTFAFIIWPIWIPLAVLKLEKIQWRRFVLYVLFIAGVFLSLLNSVYGIIYLANVEIVNSSLQYSGRLPQQSYIYPLIVVLPCFFSSLKNAWLFGLLTLLSYLIADYLYAQTFISVWCFFAAVMSLSIYKIIKDNQ